MKMLGMQIVVSLRLSILEVLVVLPLMPHLHSCSKPLPLLLLVLLQEMAQETVQGSRQVTVLVLVACLTFPHAPVALPFLLAQAQSLRVVELVVHLLKQLESVIHLVQAQILPELPLLSYPLGLLLLAKLPLLRLLQQHLPPLWKSLKRLRKSVVKSKHSVPISSVLHYACATPLALPCCSSSCTV
jgi:hypothetical protein